MNAASKVKMILILSFMSIIFILNTGITGAVFINEILPDPADEKNEWVEIYNPDNSHLNLSEWKIADENSNDSLYSDVSMITNSKYFLIVGESANMSEISENDVIFFRTAGPIGNGLRNSGENISIYNLTQFVDKVSYPSFLNKEGYSWARDENGNWSYCDSPTLGLPNVNGHSSGNETNQTNVTGVCNFSISIDSASLFNSNEKQNYYLIARDSNCIEKEAQVEYWIEDIFGNEIKAKYNTTQNVSCFKNISREWTPPEIESSEAYQIKAAIVEAGCNDSNISDNYAEKFIILKGTQPDFNSRIDIEGISLGSDGKAKFGDDVEVKVNTYKGETSKSAIEVWLENAAGNIIGKTNFNVYSKFTGYVFSIPIQINPNCDGNFPEGIYLVKIEGLDSYDENEIIVQGMSSSLCKNKIVQASGPCSCAPCSTENKNASGKDATTKKSEKNKVNETGKNITNKSVEGLISDRNSAALNENRTQNGTKTINDIRIPTGRTVSKTEENWFSSAVNGIITFFKNLLKL